jgi:hypothetical protein
VTAHDNARVKSRQGNEWPERINPELIDIERQMYAFAASQRSNEAAILGRSLLQVMPDNAGVRRFLVDLLTDRAELEAYVLILIEEGRRHHGEEPLFLAAEAVAAQRHGRAADAAKLMQAARAVGEVTPSIEVRDGERLRAAGDPEGARACFQRALEAGLGRDDQVLLRARRHLAELDGIGAHVDRACEQLQFLLTHERHEAYLRAYLTLRGKRGTLEDRLAAANAGTLLALIAGRLPAVATDTAEIERAREVGRRLKVATIYSDGRSGSYFLQTLLDSHPAIVMFPLGILRSIQHSVVAFAGALQGKSPVAVVADFARQFYGAFDTGTVRYGGMNKLGPARDEDLLVDLARFSSALAALLAEDGENPQWFFVAIHLAYHMALGRPLDDLQWIVHQEHMFSGLAALRRIVPVSWNLVVVRDLRASYASNIRAALEIGLVERLGAGAAGAPESLSAVVRTYEEACTYPARLRLAYDPGKTAVVTNEELHRQGAAKMADVARWLGIADHPCLAETTVNGRTWWGNTSKPVTGFSKHTLGREWRREYYWTDLACLEHAFRARFGAYGWTRDLPLLASVPSALFRLLNLLPFKWEIMITQRVFRCGQVMAWLIIGLSALHQGLMARHWRGLGRLANAIVWRIGRSRGCEVMNVGAYNQFFWGHIRRRQQLIAQAIDAADRPESQPFPKI